MCVIWRVALPDPRTSTRTSDGAIGRTGWPPSARAAQRATSPSPSTVHARAGRRIQRARQRVERRLPRRPGRSARRRRWPRAAPPRLTRQTSSGPASIATLPVHRVRPVRQPPPAGRVGRHRRRGLSQQQVERHSRSPSVGIAIEHPRRAATWAPARLASGGRCRRSVAAQQPPAERGGERVAGAEAVHDLDRVRRRPPPARCRAHVHRRAAAAVLAARPRPRPRSSSRVGSPRPTAAAISSSEPSTTSAMAGGIAHAGGVVGRVVPQHRPPVEVEHRGAGAAGARLQQRPRRRAATARSRTRCR